MKNTYTYSIIFMFFFVACTNKNQEQIQILEVNNIQPRIDIEGDTIDAHDGRVIQFGDTYYWYGTAYSNTNGFLESNHYVCYSSNDLKKWKKEGKLLSNQSKGVYYRPHVVYNKKNNNYVLWYNWYPKLWEGQFGVAVSDTPAGPFKIVNEDVNVLRSDVGVGDFGLFVDEDQSCYISYNTIQNHQVSIEKLDENYTKSTMKNGGVIAEHMEAGALFKNKNKYYLLTDYTCCFCNYGSGARVYVSDNPLDGYELTGNINRYPGNPSHILNDSIERGTIYETIEKQKTTFNAIQVEFSSQTLLDTIEIFLFNGNRPENCGDINNPKVHPEIPITNFKIFAWDFNRWEEIEVITNNRTTSALQEKLSIGIAQTKTNKIKILPTSESYPFNKIYINEIYLKNNSKSIQNALFYVTGPTIPQRPIIPAQQTYVMKLNTINGEKFVWMGDLWGSAKDNIKGHDFQYWSKPLEFYEDGTIKPMEWTDTWSIQSR